MQQFRNLLKGWLGKALLFIFILPFAFFGIEGIFNSNGNQDVAITVNGVEISKMEVNRGIENQRRNLKQQMGGNIDDSFLTDDLLRPRVIEGLIQKELIRQASESEGLAVSSNLVKSYVRSMPQFQDESGEFSNDRLESLLVQANYTKARLFGAVQESMVLEQLQSGIGATAFITSPELEYMVKLNAQKRDIRYAKLEAPPLKESIELNDDELQAYYEMNKAQYRTQEKVQVQYVVLSLDDFKDGIEVPDTEITAAYDDYVANLKSQERRRASHILVEINDDRTQDEAKHRIEEALAKIDAGADFASVAKGFSDDIATANNGGDLDFSGKGVYDNSFEEALFGLSAEGDLSGVVQTEFGFHIIKLTGIEIPDIASFDKMKPELTASIQADIAREKMDEAIDKINRLAYESGDLQLISETYAKPISTTAFFTRQGGPDIAADPAFVTAAFSEMVVDEGHNSEIVELADGRIAVVRLAQHENSREQPFNEVESLIRDSLVQQKVRELAKARAEEIVSKIEQGEGLEALQSEYSITWQKVDGATRQSTDLSRTVISTAFEMPKPAEGANNVQKVSLPNGDQEIVVLNSVKEGKYSLTESEALRAKTSAGQQFGSQDFNSYIASLKDSAEIQIH
jgi:peptidyl-prolyl cis-trans isomerase D